MTLTHIIFIVFAAITLLSGLFCVTTRNMFHAALYLVISLFGVASMFAMLEASFLAAAQVIVYVGAVAILIIFAVMLTAAGPDRCRPSARSTRRRGWPPWLPW